MAAGHAAGLEEVLSSVPWMESHSVTRVPVDAVVFEGSPRLGGEDPGHIRMLAEAGDALPPIIVHRPTMRVIDGVHRVRAALLNGSTEINARLLDCDENVAFLLAVKANITHGLPLLQADRAAAAARIIADNPEWSDRAVAAATGLSDKTISRIRGCSTADLPQSNSRRGRDGRLRPLNSGVRRREAAALISERPAAGLREVARATGLSVATVRDVRQRIGRGEDPVPGRYRSGSGPGSAPASLGGRTYGSGAPGQRGRSGSPADRRVLLERLRSDPSLKFSEAGRQALRWLHHHTVDGGDLEDLGSGLPDHWAPVVASLARSCAAQWASLAERLEQRDY